MSVDCTNLKKDYYNCIKSHELSFNPELLRFKFANSNVNNLAIPEEILKKCLSINFAKCLEVKYELKSINERELSEYYSEKYKKLTLSNNKPNLNK